MVFPYLEFAGLSFRATSGHICVPGSWNYMTSKQPMVAYDYELVAPQALALRTTWRTVD
jgi:hypothetical protein